MAKILMQVVVFFAYMLVPIIQATCPAEYSQIASDHTRCSTPVGPELPLSSSDIQAIVDVHNQWRSNVSQPAADMQTMTWDETLAETALMWARSCVFGHDSYEQRSEPSLPGVTIGQNIAVNYPSVVAAIYSPNNEVGQRGWAEEIRYFTYGQQPGGVTGHYTQIVYAKAALVGCGMANCTGHSLYSNHIVCNYAVGQGDILRPYVASSESCANCSTSCVSNKCDCSKVCLNGGTIDVGSCTCTCTVLFTGPTCDEDTCPSDNDNCGYWLSVIDNACDYNNIQDDCPRACNLC